MLKLKYPDAHAEVCECVVLVLAQEPARKVIGRLDEVQVLAGRCE